MAKKYMIKKYIIFSGGQVALDEDVECFPGDPWDILDSINDSVFTVDVNGIISFISHRFTASFGYQLEEVLGRRFTDILPREYRRAALMNFRSGLEGRRTPLYETVIEAKDGRNVPVELSMENLLDGEGRVCGRIGVIRDITERRLVEAALEDSEEKYRTVFENSGTSIIMIEEDDSISLVNSEFERLTGFRKAEVTGRVWTDLVHEADRERVEEFYRNRRANPDRAPRECEFRVYDKQGRIRYIFSTLSLIQEGKRSIASMIDITKRKKAEDDLRESREWFARAFNDNPLPMLIIDYREGRLVEVNNSFLQVTGFPRREVIGCRVRDLNIWECQKQYERIRELVINQKSIKNLEGRFRTKWGQELDWLVSLERLALGGKIYVFAVINDVTEIRKLESQVTRLDRLNLVGEIAASIGHEIRNPISIVRGFLQLLGGKQGCAECQHNSREFFDLMIGELDRANGIITEFLTLARKKQDFQSDNLNSIIEALLPLLQADAAFLDKSVKVRLEDIPDLMLDEKEIRQLILNLARNGLEAMDGGGTLTIRTSDAGEEVVLAVEDQGSGMDSEVLKKIGTPFFTTKDEGTGLGLAVCYSIAAHHNAIIDVETGPNGSTFRVRFKKSPTEAAGRRLGSHLSRAQQLAIL